MSFKKPDLEYWNNKFTAYMHDPIDKVFDIKTHEERAQKLLSKFGLEFPNDDFWKTADGIASGFERGQVPSYNQNENKNGAIDFFKNPFISHPTSLEKGLNINLPDDLTSKDISEQLLEFIGKTIGIKAGEGGYSDKFKGYESQFALARFLYTHLVLRFKLAEENVANLGALWHRLPADSRFPDHSIWQHNQLTSAIYSCMELSKGGNEARKNNIGLMVFSITPVQPFISKARKLRDFWSASVLLSYLAFEGIVWVIEHLGADHIIYPSLIDQPLIGEYLKQNYEVDDDFKPELWKKHDKTIANFPNKFLFLAPFDKIEDIGESLQTHIQTKWNEIEKIVFGFLIRRLDLQIDSKEAKYLLSIFDRQNKKFWDLQWSGVRLVDKNDFNEVKDLLVESSYGNQFNVLEIFNKIIKDKKHYEKAGKGVLYSVSHSLVQSALASSKTQKEILRDEEPGEKCQMCGEFEVLHTKEYKNDITAKAYSENIKSFWKKLSEKIPDFNENERLCSVCLIKRLIALAINSDHNPHILKSVFKNYDSFPSTTYISLYNYYKREKIDDSKKKEKAQKLFESNTDTIDGIKDRDKYYAILLMDGDKMGDLINGKTIASTWETIMHPDILKRLQDNPNFEEKYRENWKEIFENYPKRLLTPSIHAAISEALGDFAIYGVSSIIKKYDGRLIYAGGDDVCAIMPVDTVLDAANEIQKYYKSSFRLIHLDGNSEEIENEFSPEKGKLSINLGKGDKISISAGILICHHKENLSEMIRRAHALLDRKAKDEAGRNACAIELKKRSGGSRYFVRQWSDEEVWKSFDEVGSAIKKSKREGISTSLVYRLETFRFGIEAIMFSDNDEEKKKYLLEKFIAKQLDRSQLTVDNDEMAKIIRDIVIDKRGQFEPEGLIVAGFIQGGEQDD